jgi:hypothetical protein
MLNILKPKNSLPEEKLKHYSKNRSLEYIVGRRKENDGAETNLDSEPKINRQTQYHHLLESLGVFSNLHSCIQNCNEDNEKGREG